MIWNADKGTSEVIRCPLTSKADAPLQPRLSCLPAVDEATASEAPQHVTLPQAWRHPPCHAGFCAAAELAAFPCIVIFCAARRFILIPTPSPTTVHLTTHRPP